MRRTLNWSLRESSLRVGAQNISQHLAAYAAGAARYSVTQASRPVG